MVQLPEASEDEWTKEKLRSLTDDGLVARAREPYANFLNSVLRFVDSAMSYEQKYTEAERITSNLKAEYGSAPVAGCLIDWSGAYAGQILRQYGFQIRDTAYLNALRAAIEIYLATAKTGQLPDTLPDYPLNHPCSGQDFEYETTKEGFILRCRAKDIDASPKKYKPG